MRLSDTVAEGQFQRAKTFKQAFKLFASSLSQTLDRLLVVDFRSPPTLTIADRRFIKRGNRRMRPRQLATMTPTMERKLVVFRTQMHRLGQLSASKRRNLLRNVS